MRKAVLLLLALSAACTTDYEGLGFDPATGGRGSGGHGGTPSAGGSGGPAGGRRGGAGAAGGTAGLGGMGAGGSATGGAGTGGVAVGGAAGGVAGAAGAGNQAGSGGGAGGVGGAGGQGLPSGASCDTGAQCATGFCFDGTCCQSDCTGACRSCANSTGTCTLAPAMSDPRDDCAADATNSCGRTGFCSGTGTCALAAAGTVCQSGPVCDATHATVIAGAACDGAGVCAPSPPVSCNGFACAAGACQNSCSDDSACAPGAFCSAATCVAVPNLAGNGDLETGTLTGWSAFGGDGTLGLSSSYWHTGQFSVDLSGRSKAFQGPSYALPTGLGRYTIGIWAMQAQDTSPPQPNLIAQIRLVCLNSTSYVTVQSGVGTSAPAGIWVHLVGDVDTRTDPGVAADCFADGAGLVRSATLFVNQADSSGVTALPDLYADDLVVESGDGHNLIGNPNFETGMADGWSTTGGASSLGVSNSFAHGGQRSLSQSGRTLPSSAVTYALPLGAARYAVSLWALQGGTTDHQLALLPLYSCVGSTVVHFAAPSAAVTAAAGAWTQLSGSFVFPPADAPAGCVLSQASVAVGQAETGDCGSTVECPDLFVDDASITLK